MWFFLNYSCLVEYDPLLPLVLCVEVSLEDIDSANPVILTATATHSSHIVGSIPTAPIPSAGGRSATPSAKFLSDNLHLMSFDAAEPSPPHMVNLEANDLVAEIEMHVHC